MTNVCMEDIRKELMRESRILLKKKCKALKVSGEGNKSHMIHRIMMKKYGNNKLYENIEQQTIQHTLESVTNQLSEYIAPETTQNTLELETNELSKNIEHHKTYILNKFNCNLLVTGYIRRLDKLINMLIPTEIVTLCFNNYFQVLPSYRVHELCCVDEEENIFSTPGTASGCFTTFAIFKTPWKEGIHELKFECIHDVGCAVGIGVVTNFHADCTKWLFDSAASHLSYQLYSLSEGSGCNIGIYCFENGTQKLFEPIQQKVSDGIVISMIVDLDEWQIIYYLNEIQAGNAMPIEKNQTYYPAIAYNTRNRRWDKENNKFHQYRLLLCV